MINTPNKLEGDAALVVAAKLVNEEMRVLFADAKTIALECKTARLASMKAREERKLLLPAILKDRQS